MESEIGGNPTAVSYTHLDVYKRQECIQTMVVLRGGQTMNYILNINFQKSVNLAPADKTLKIRGAKIMS